MVYPLPRLFAPWLVCCQCKGSQLHRLERSGLSWTDAMFCQKLGYSPLYTATKIPFRYSQKRNWATLVPHIHVYVSDLYIHRIGPHISCSRIGRPIVRIYKLLTDTCMWKIWTEAAQFLFWEHINGIFISVYYKGHLQSLVASSQCPEEAYWRSIAG